MLFLLLAFPAIVIYYVKLEQLVQKKEVQLGKLHLPAGKLLKRNAGLRIQTTGKTVSYTIVMLLSILAISFQLFIVLAGWPQSAFFAFWIAGHADVSAMKYEPMVGFVNKLYRNVFQQLFFNSQWS